jgi:hypothetical protein
MSLIVSIAENAPESSSKSLSFARMRRGCTRRLVLQAPDNRSGQNFFELMDIHVKVA